MNDQKNVSLPSKEKPHVQTASTPTGPPNGGLTAWLQVLGSFFLYFASWGLANTFGVFQTYYETHLLASSSPSNISWIGSIQAFLLILIGIVTGPIYDRGYLRTLIVVGSVLIVFGMMMTSISTKYYQVFLAQGICVGLGSGCLFVPSVAIVATYFTTKRAFATGVAATGGSIGGVLYPIAFRRMLEEIGFGWSTRVLGFITLACLLTALAIMRPRMAPAKPRALLDLSAFKDVTYTIFSFSLLSASTGLYIPFFYVQIYAQRLLDTNTNFAFYLLAIMNAASIFGRLVPNYTADKIGPLNTIFPCALLSGVLCFCWIAVDSTAGIVVFCAFYGFFSGAIVSIPPSVVVSLSTDMSTVGTRMGMCFAFAAVGMLIGSPIAGTMINIPEGRFKGAQIFCGAVLLGGALFMFLARTLRYNKTKSWRG